MEKVIQERDTLGEGPIWDSQNQRLYWVDLAGCRINRFVPATQEHTRWETPSEACYVALTDDPGLLFVVLKDRFALLNLDTGELTVEEGSRLNSEAIRFNDGGVDRHGRLWIGTMDLEMKRPIGSLYLLTHGVLCEEDQGLTISNGIAWSLDNRTMYLTDSVPRLIYKYEYDPTSGALSNREVHIRVPEDVGLPDGLTIDCEGYLWSVHWSGSRITRYAPDGSVDQVVELPVTYPTSCCFGGEALTTLYITSINQDDEGGELLSHPTPVPGIVESRISLNHYFLER